MIDQIAPKICQSIAISQTNKTTFLSYGVVHKWRHVILNVFDPLSSLLLRPWYCCHKILDTLPQDRDIINGQPLCWLILFYQSVQFEFVYFACDVCGNMFFSSLRRLTRNSQRLKPILSETNCSSFIPWKRLFSRSLELLL